MANYPWSRPKSRGLCTRGCGILVIGVLFVSGCTPWPRESNGGMSERQATESKEILELERRNAMLVNAGANELAASQAVDVRLLLVRASREYAAELFEDYVETISKTDLILSRMERKLGKYPKAPRLSRAEY